MNDEPKTVGTLRAALADLPDDLPIYLSRDEEGNGYNRLYYVETCKYADGYSVHPDDVEDYTPEDLIDAVILWP